MGILNDVGILYDSLRSTWARSRADLVAHIILIIVIFGICGATLPQIKIPSVDPAQIANNEWFKLAKDTGLIYLSLAIPVVALIVYVAVLRTIGQLLVTLLTLFFPPHPERHFWKSFTSGELEPLALMIKNEEFALYDLYEPLQSYLYNYQAGKNQQIDLFMQYTEHINRTSVIYLGDFGTFLLIWILIFYLAPTVAWTQANETRYWPVLFILFCLAWFSWFRVSRTLKVMPIIQLRSVSMILRHDPDKATLLNVSEERRNQVKSRLEMLISQEKEASKKMSAPSIRDYLLHQTELHKILRRPTRDGQPFPNLYKEGEQFSYQEERHRQYDSDWLYNYVAFLYYRLHRRLLILASSLRHFVRYIVTGAPS